MKDFATADVQVHGFTMKTIASDGKAMCPWLLTSFRCTPEDQNGGIFEDSGGSSHTLYLEKLWSYEVTFIRNSAPANVHLQQTFLTRELPLSVPSNVWPSFSPDLNLC